MADRAPPVPIIQDEDHVDTFLAPGVVEVAHVHNPSPDQYIYHTTIQFSPRQIVLMGTTLAPNHTMIQFFGRTSREGHHSPHCTILMMDGQRTFPAWIQLYQ